MHTPHNEATHFFIFCTQVSRNNAHKHIASDIQFFVEDYHKQTSAISTQDSGELRLRQHIFLQHGKSPPSLDRVIWSHYAVQEQVSVKLPDFAASTENEIFFLQFSMRIIVAKYTRRSFIICPKRMIADLQSMHQRVGSSRPDPISNEYSSSFFASMLFGFRSIFKFHSASRHY